ncbi:hypothetical protein COB28_04175 [Candidatus Dependentiae bacterium]|nr:MAG: hypothetical protein COB28_04175 [Candidatus Dependentiae bacterium]
MISSNAIRFLLTTVLSASALSAAMDDPLKNLDLQTQEFFKACGSGDKETASRILENVAQLEEEDVDVQKSFLSEINDAEIEMNRILRIIKSFIHQQDLNGDTPYHYAVDQRFALSAPKETFVAIIKLLERSKADMYKENNKGKSAFDIASEKKDVNSQIFESMIEINKEKESEKDSQNYWANGPCTIS